MCLLTVHSALNIQHFILQSAYAIGGSFGGAVAHFQAFKFLNNDVNLQTKILVIAMGALLGCSIVLNQVQDPEITRRLSEKYGMVASSVGAFEAGAIIGAVFGGITGLTLGLGNNIGFIIQKN